MTNLASFIWAAGGQDAVKRITEAVVAKVGDEVLAQTVRDCPVDTGTLANSYTRSTPTREGGGVKVEVGTPVYYGPFVEFGTRKMRAQPHLGPALEAARRRYG